jgi:V-type H+-transporting ATPase subunit H
MDGFSRCYSDHIHVSSQVMVLSKPESLLLQSAEENPLEYTLAEYDDAFLYVRVLLKLLDQVTTAHASAESGADDGMVVASTDLGGVDFGNHVSLSEEEALELYSHDKIGVTSHYVITRLYELMGSLIERQQQQLQYRSSRKTSPVGNQPSVTIFTLFYHFQYNDSFSNNNKDFLIDEWRPLMKILHKANSDDFSKRGAALVLAYILMAGCEEQWSTKGILAPSINSFESQVDLKYYDNVVTETLQSLISWLTSRLQSSHTTSLGIVTPTLMVLVTLPRARRFFDQAGGIGYLARQVKNFHRNHQRHKQLNNRRRNEQNALGQKLTTSRQDYFQNSLNKKDDGANEGIGLLQTMSSTMSKALCQSPQRRRNGSAMDTSSMRRPLSSGDSINGNASEHNPGQIRSSRNLALSGSILPGLTEVSSSLVSQIADMLPSPVSLATTDKSLPSSPLPFSRTSIHNNSSHHLGISHVHSLVNSNSVAPSSHATSSSVQQLYELVFAFWCMAMDCPEREELRQHFARDGAVSALVQVLQTAPREKVLRLTVSTLRLLATFDQDSSKGTTPNLNPSSDTISNITSATFVREMVAGNIQKPLTLLQQREWNDPDLQDDLNVLYKTVQAHTKELTQWNVYQAELDSGVLQWSSPFHCSEFFRHNARLMEGPKGDFAPLEKLVQILYRHTQNGRLSSTRGSKIMYVGLKEVVVPRSTDRVTSNNGVVWDHNDVNDDELCETLAVALYDIGEFVRHYPNGRRVIACAERLQRTQLDHQDSILGKTKILVVQYLQHPREGVQSQALSCMSKLLVQNWNVR